MSVYDIWLNLYVGKTFEETKKVVASNAPIRARRVTPCGPYPLTVLDGWDGETLPPLPIKSVKEARRGWWNSTT